MIMARRVSRHSESKRAVTVWVWSARGQSDATYHGFDITRRDVRPIGALRGIVISLYFHMRAERHLPFTSHALAPPCIGYNVKEIHGGWDASLRFLYDI